MSNQITSEPLINLDFDLSMGQTQPLVSVGIVNCNRLHYLRSCLESFLECTEDYTNKEVIVKSFGTFIREENLNFIDFVKMNNAISGLPHGP